MKLDTQSHLKNILQVAALDLAATKYLTLAALTLLVYDYFLTLGDEVALIWPARLGLIKIIYFFNRYVVTAYIAVTFVIISGQATFLTDLICQRWLLLNVCLQIVAIQTTSFVVAARVYDIWQRPRTSFLTLGTIWVIHCVIDFIIVADNAVRQFSHLGYVQTFNVCSGDVTSSWTAWLNSIVYHAMILCLLVWLWISTPRSAQTPFMKLVIRDGFVYFAAIFTAMLFNLLVWRYGRTSLVGLPYWSMWAMTTHALLRLLLSMGSVQSSKEWGQRASIVHPPPDIELGARVELKMLNTVSAFSDDGIRLSRRSGTHLSVVGKFQD